MAAREEALAEHNPTLGLERRAPLSNIVILDRLHRIDPERRIDVMVIRDGGLVDCFVPFDLIDNDEVAVDEKYADDLAEQFRQLAAKEGGTGQHTPSMVGLIESEPVLRIMDGYHRSAGLKQNDEDRLYTTAKVTDWDGLYDFRIFTAKDHPHVRYSRVVQWMRENWERTGLPDRLSLEQAVVLYRFSGSGKKLKDAEGNPIHLAPEEAEYVKEWVARKEKEQGWGLAAMTFHRYLKAAEHVDPQLVHAARESQGSHSLDAPTQTIIEVFSKELPDKFDLQHLVMDAAREVRVPANGGPRVLQGPEIRALCRYVQDARSLRVAKLRIGKIDWPNWKPVYGRTINTSLRQAYDARNKGPVVLDKIANDIASILARIEQSFERGEEITPDMKKKLRATRERALELAPQLGQVIIRLSDLLGETPPLLTAVPDLNLQSSAASQRTPETGGAEEPGEDFDPTDDGFLPDDDEVIPPAPVEEEEEEPEEVETLPSDDIWDADVFDEEDDDEVDEESAVIVHKSRLEEADGSETAASSKFKDALRAYLDGKADDYPDITNRLQIQWAENMLVGGRFSGPNYLQDDLRDELRQAEKKIRERVIPPRPKLRRDQQAKLDNQTV